MRNGFARHVKREAERSSGAAAALVLFLSLSRFTGRGSLVNRSSRALAPPQHLYSSNGKYFKYWERGNSDTVFFCFFLIIM